MENISVKNLNLNLQGLLLGLLLLGYKPGGFDKG